MQPRRNAIRSKAIAALMLVAALALAGCQLEAPPHNDFPDLTYGHLPPLAFRVAEIEIVEAYRPTLEPPHVELDLPVSLSQKAAKWGRDRLIAVGGGGQLRYIVRQASVTEEQLPKTGGLEGLWTVDQAERYEAILIIEVVLTGLDGAQLGNATASAHRTTTMAENISLTEREQAWFALVERVMNDINGQLEITLREVFAGHMAN